MTQCIVLVDNSNIFIEGAKFSAKRKGVARLPSDTRDAQDPSWRLDFGKLLTELADNRSVNSAILVGSRPPPNDGVWRAASANGFEVITHNRDVHGREKAVDTELVAQGTKLVCTVYPPGCLVIASGDRDFLPLVRVAQEMGWRVEMCAFTSAFQSGGEMAVTVDQVRSLDGAFGRIGHHEFDWPSAEYEG